MTPTGCQCIVTQIKAVQQKQDKQSSSFTPRKFRKTSYLIKKKSHVVLPGVIPGMILQASLSSYGNIISESRLPQGRNCSILSFKLHGRWLHPCRSSFQPLSCMSASKRSCEHCPWMMSDVVKSADIKAEALRRVLHSVAETASSTRLQTTTHAIPMVHFLEPLSVLVKPHSLQELELPYTQAKVSGSGVLIEKKVDGGFSISATAPEGSSTLRDCFLLTLEEKRLIPSLNRWASQLPAVMRGSLKMAYVTQLSPEMSAISDPGVEPPSVSSLQELRWLSTLSLVVLLNRDVQNWGPQSPLCGPNHPPDLLSHEEEALVDAVLTAASLQKDIHVLICLDGNELDILYPVVKRGIRWDDIADNGRASPAGIPARPALSCICGSMEALVHVPLPGFHSHLFCSLQSGYLHQTMSKEESTKYLYAARPAFWRNCGALSVACSVVATLLLDSDTPSLPPFVVGLFVSGILNTTGASVTSSAAVKLKPASLASSQAASMLFNAALSATIREFTSKLAQGNCLGVLNLKGIGKERGEDVIRALDSASFFMIATLAESSIDSLEVCNLLHAWQDRLLQANTHPTPIARLMLLQCSTDMELDALKAVVKKILESPGRPTDRSPMRLHVDRLQAGIIDVDPFSASFVGYTFIELSWR